MSGPTPEEQAARMEAALRSTAIRFPKLTPAQRARLAELHAGAEINPLARPPKRSS